MAILDEFTHADLVKHLLAKALEGSPKEIMGTIYEYIDYVDYTATRYMKEKKVSGPSFSANHVNCLVWAANHCIQRVADIYSEGIDEIRLPHLPKLEEK